MYLVDLSVGEQATVSAVLGEGALRCRLLDMGLIPKTIVRVVRIAPLGDPIEINVRGYELTLRKEDAAQIEVENVCEYISPTEQEKDRTSQRSKKSDVRKTVKDGETSEVGEQSQHDNASQHGETPEKTSQHSKTSILKRIFKGWGGKRQ